MFVLAGQNKQTHLTYKHGCVIKDTNAKRHFSESDQFLVYVCWLFEKKSRYVEGDRDKMKLRHVGLCVWIGIVLMEVLEVGKCYIFSSIVMGEVTIPAIRPSFGGLKLLKWPSFS